MGGKKGIHTNSVPDRGSLHGGVSAPRKSVCIGQGGGGSSAREISQRWRTAKIGQRLRKTERLQQNPKRDRV